jgi:hypothetical protein
MRRMCQWENGGERDGGKEPTESTDREERCIKYCIKNSNKDELMTVAS